MVARESGVGRSIQVSEDRVDELAQLKTFMAKCDEELLTQPDNFVEYTQVVDKAILGKITQLVKIRDPVDNRVIVNIRNPGVPIKPYKEPKKAHIDLNKSITNGERNPNITCEPHMRYSTSFKGWQAMVSVVSDKRKQKQLWD